MKITYKNTALAFLEDPMNFPFYIPEHTVPAMTDQEANKRLQWISDFTKHGYTKRAKILRDND